MSPATSRPKSQDTNAPRKPLGLLIGEKGGIDIRKSTPGFPPDGYTPVWFSKSRNADMVKTVCEILRVESALICTDYEVGYPGHRGRPIHTGVLVPTEEAERVARVLALIETRALSRPSSGATKLYAVSNRVRVDVVELPADPEAVRMAEDKP